MEVSDLSVPLLSFYSNQNVIIAKQYQCVNKKCRVKVYNSKSYSSWASIILKMCFILKICFCFVFGDSNIIIHTVFYYATLF